MSGERDKETNAKGPRIRLVPEGDDHERLVCPDCGFVAYDNPKVVVGAVCVWEDKVLLCRRAIAPREGYWTMPAGFMEMDESTAEGAVREVWEEARAEVQIEDLLGVFEIPRIGQVYVVYRARMLSPDCAVTAESSEVVLLDRREIPWDDLAFPSVTWALKTYLAAKAEPQMVVSRAQM